MSYRELMALTNRIAHVLVQDMGLQAGNRVLLRGPNNPMMAACWLAAVKAGLVTVPTMPLLRADELEKAISNATLQAVLLYKPLVAEHAHCPEHKHGKGEGR